MMYPVLTEVEIPVGGNVSIKGDLTVPPQSESLVIFSHGSGSSRFSIRNRFVAEYLQQKKIATLLIDLLQEAEDLDHVKKFDIELLSNRLMEVTSYMLEEPSTSSFPIGFFGASTGAASALRAAAQLPGIISAVVSRGGRPDLAAGFLDKVKAPTLLIVGSLDKDVVLLNRKAFALLSHEKKIEIIDGASHLFEEPGKLNIVAEMAAEWFTDYLKF